MTVLGRQETLVAIRAVPVATAREFEGELDRCAEIVARRMRRHAPKFRSLLAVSVRRQSPAPFERDIGPTAAYAAAQEQGVRPGGKGLPRFEDAAAADVKAWLQAKVFRGAARAAGARGQSGAIAALSLRDRYEGLARHIRRAGVKASPFILRSLNESEAEIRARLEAAGARVIERSGGQA
jgi:hypothetical protein